MTITAPNDTHFTYRPDIDGLRAIAVLAVVTFHAFPSLISGGFIGVDVFFVISGYLISSNIFENLEKGSFSFSDFFYRRIKRILPALVLVLIASYIFGWFYLLADEFKQLGEYLASAAVFISNLALWRDVGYFDNSAETKPLLHLWSLAIEEQFYIIWPLILWLAWKCKLNFLVVIFFIGALSFILNIYYAHQNIIIDFYSPQTRFWELLSGSLLGWYHFQKRLHSPSSIKSDNLAIAVAKFKRLNSGSNLLSNTLSLIGSILLLAGFWMIDKGYGFPGKWAVFPVMGSALIICAGSKAFINEKILSNKLLVWFGLISYPLYLWHWPLLTFARIVEGVAPSIITRIGIVALSVFLSWLTFRFIEQPIRRVRNGKSLVILLTIILASIGCVGFYTYTKDGFEMRFSNMSIETKIRYQKVANAWRFRSYPPEPGLYIDPKYNLPRLGENNNSIVLIVGDSHADQYKNAIGQFMQRKDAKNFPSVIFQGSDWPPLFNGAIMEDPAVKTVVFSYFWAMKYKSNKVHLSVRCCGSGKGGSAGGVDYFPPPSIEQLDLRDEELKRIVNWLRNNGKRVFFILDNPFGEELDPHSMIQRSWLGFEVASNLALDRAVAIERAEPVRSRLIKLARMTGAELIDPFASLCNKNICPSFSDDGELLNKDYDHLSLNASRNYSNFIYQALSR